VSNRSHWPKRRIIICDIDNCISLDAWRQQLIIPSGQFDRAHNWSKYHAYHLASAKDEAHFIPEMEDAMRRRTDVYFFTAMPEYYRRLRTNWFIRNGKRPSNDHIYMRANYDMRSSVDVKRDMTKFLIDQLGHHNIYLAYDDRMDVLEMYAKEFGIKPIHRSLHGQGHYDH
jgi:hypothetical protein